MKCLDILFIYHHYDNQNGFLDFYRSHFYDYSFEYKHYSLFDNEKYLFDAFFLLTDDDYQFKRNDMMINNKTICIEHYVIIRSPVFIKRIATRPFPQPYYRRWALPLYPMIDSKTKLNNIMMNSYSNTLNIVICGYTENIYNISVINRLKSENNKKIVIYGISRDIKQEHFKGIDENFTLKLFNNIDANEFYEILYHSHFVLVDVSSKPDHCKYQMSGIIPMAISTLTPLIILKETNSYYQFKNVIEYDISNKNIILKDIDLFSLENERDNIIKENNELIQNLLLE